MWPAPSSIGSAGIADACAAARQRRVGPNAIIQTQRALEECEDVKAAAAIFQRAGLGHYLRSEPAEMVVEDDVARLFATIRRTLAVERAEAVLRIAGQLTGRYILAHRIPAAAQVVLKASPAVLAAPLLMKAIAAHAWTFAGSGEVTTALWPRLEITIAANPLATPGCPWHLGVLETLFQTLARPSAQLVHTQCCGRGDAACRTRVHL